MKKLMMLLVCVVIGLMAANVVVDYECDKKLEKATFERACEELKELGYKVTYSNMEEGVISAWSVPYTLEIYNFDGINCTFDYEIHNQIEETVWNWR